MNFSHMCAISHCLPPFITGHWNANYTSYVSIRLIWQSCFIDNFLLYFNRKLKLKKGNTQMEFKYLLFCVEQMNDLFGWKDIKDVYRLQKKFGRWQFDQKICLKEIWCWSFYGYMTLATNFAKKGSSWKFCRQICTHFYTKTNLVICDTLAFFCYFLKHLFMFLTNIIVCNISK